MSIPFYTVRLLEKAHPEQPRLNILMMVIDVISPYTLQACIPPVVCVRFLRPSALLPGLMHLPPLARSSQMSIVVPFALRYTALG